LLEESDEVPLVDATERGQEWGLRSSSQLWLGFIRHSWIPLLKPVAQFLVEDMGPDL